MKSFEKCSILKETDSHYSDSSIPWDNQTRITDSCWLIEFTDGHKIIVSEELYGQEKDRNWAGRSRLVEQHWFDFRKCRERNRGIGIYGFGVRV